ncbi:MAG TPA: VWA domain-containing protein [Thermoanaerobaculia bacterium]|nr:VWA domain-containing protein [Thermoanaerobaculia bacterium]
MRPWSIRFAAVAAAVLLIAASPRDTSLKRTDLPRLGGESIEVSIVNLDVFVTDAKGNRVHGLTKDDFEILEDGKPQAITNFSEYGADASPVRVSLEQSPAAAAKTVEPAVKPQPRTLIVFVDRMRLASFEAEPVFRSLRTLLHNAVRQGDAAMIVTWAYRMRVIQPFTNDLDKLDAALVKLERASQVIAPDSAMDDIASERIWREQIESDYRMRGAGGAPDRGPTLSAREGAQRAYSELKRKTAAINALMSGISGAEGKKVLLLASHRLSDIAGLEYLKFQDGPTGQYQGQYGTRYFIESIAHTANANGITVYTLFPEGLGTHSVVRADQRPIPRVSNADMITHDYLVLNNELPSLKYIADRTGGAMAWSAKEVAAFLPRVGEDLDQYYSLAYSIASKSQDRARAIVVKTKNPSYVVRSRREFVERSDETKMKDRVIANLFREPDASVLSISAVMGTATRKSNDRFLIPLSIRVPVRGLATLLEGQTRVGAFSVIVASTGAWGDVSEVTYRTQRFTIPLAELEKTKGTFFTYDVEILADRMAKRLSIAVQDEVSKDYGFSRVELPPRAGAPVGGR